MKKFLLAILLAQISGNAMALGSGNIGISCWLVPQECQSAESDGSCTSSICRSCSGISAPSIPTGYTGSVGTIGVRTSCASNGQTFSCKCGADTSSSAYTIKCASGYYGTASYSYSNGHNFSGCTKCPANATCAGGNGSGFVCAQGYYKDGNACSRCPSFGTTAGTGSTTKTQCYLPSGTTFSESVGSGTYTANCPYVN